MVNMNKLILPFNKHTWSNVNYANTNDNVFLVVILTSILTENDKT